MNVLNKSFIYFLITINSFDTTNTSNNTHIINDKYFATDACNQQFWTALLTLLETDSSITLTMLVEKYPDIKEDITKLYRVISDDNAMHYYDINKFLFSLNQSDYTILMSYLEPDGLNTPSDWSSIGSSDEELEDVVISFNLNEEIHSPIHSDNSLHDKVETIPPVETIQVAIPEPSPIITSAPRSISFYDPSMIPQREYMSKRTNYREYCTKKEKYSWYISYIVQCAEWIQVPNCIKKYF